MYVRTTPTYSTVAPWGRATASTLIVSAREMMTHENRSTLVKANGRKVEAMPAFERPTVHKVIAPKKLARII